MKRWLAGNWFIVALPGAVGLAFAFPAPGAPGGWLYPEMSTKAAIALIFLLQGVTLALGSLREGLFRWRLHVLVQGFTYIVFPLLGIALDRLVGQWLPAELRWGFLFLAVLPTTVSTAIVLTALAGGNAAGALLNATLSNVLGVVVTPLWIGLLLEVRGEPVPVLPLMRELALLIVLPLAAGQALRRFVRRRFGGRSGWESVANRSLVLFIVYAAFCDSVRSGVFVEHGWSPALVAGGGAVLFLALMMLLTIAAARLLRLRPADRIAAVFCAPQKTLASGAPMAKLIFAADPGLGLILLPVMFYHPLQLLVGGVLVNVIKARNHHDR
ncbi:MAG: bile acid:sodium symporter family protein [Opitutaceae bacterium]